MPLSLNQKDRLGTILQDIINAKDQGKVDLTDATLEYIFKWFQAIRENEDGQTAYYIIHEWHNAWDDKGGFHVQDFVRKLMNKAIVVDI